MLARCGEDALQSSKSASEGNRQACRSMVHVSILGDRVCAQGAVAVRE